MNSSNPHTDSTLARINSREAYRFLKELINLRHAPEAIRRFETRFGAILSDRLKTGERSSPLALADGMNVIVPTIELRDSLRMIWKAADQRTKDWAIIRMIDAVVIEEANPREYSGFSAFSRDNDRLIPLPTPTLLEQILTYLRKQAHRTKVCSCPGCPAPYFLARRRSQKFCSDACSLPSQREFKRSWWAKHGKTWRRRKRRSRAQK
jgi:hypothetical protein